MEKPCVTLQWKDFKMAMKKKICIEHDEEGMGDGGRGKGYIFYARCTSQGCRLFLLINVHHICEEFTGVFCRQK